MAEVRTYGLTKRYGDSDVVWDLSLDLPDGEMTVVLGPSGCGKTTLLRILAGLTAPDRGEVRIGETLVNDPAVRIPPEDRGVGMVFQDSLLWPHMRVRANIGFALGPGRKNDPRVEAAARTAEVHAFLDRYPSELSGGEQRRAAIARAVVREPQLLLMDEPLSGLDANLRVTLAGTIRSIQRRLRVTTCYVTHDQEEALGIADRVVVMHRGEVLQTGTPEEIYGRPATAFVAGFVGTATLFRGRGGLGEYETPFGRIAAGGADGEDVLFAARPETVHLSAETGVPGIVVRSSFLGDRFLIAARVGDLEVLSLSRFHREDGEEVRISLDPAPVAVIDDLEESSFP